MNGEVAMLAAVILTALVTAVFVWLLLRGRLAAERARAEQLVHADRERDRYGRMLENLADGFLAFEPDGQLAYANRQAAAMLNEATAHVFRPERRDGPSHRQLRITIHQHDGGELNAGRLLIDRWIEAHAYPSDDGLSVYLHDNTERRRREERIRQSTMVDDLTGLHNRRGFFTLAEQHLKLAERTGRNVLLMFADLDDFKAINDQFGHHEGDRALADASRVLRGVFRDSDIISRIGGDEFAILALETSEVSGDILSRRLRDALETRNARSRRGYAVTLSLGIARFDPRNPATIADLLARADALMYEHKRQKELARRVDMETPPAASFSDPPLPPPADSPPASVPPDS